jgi:hypothetical protein
MFGHLLHRGGQSIPGDQEPDAIHLDLEQAGHMLQDREPQLLREKELLKAILQPAKSVRTDMPVRVSPLRGAREDAPHATQLLGGVRPPNEAALAEESGSAVRGDALVPAFGAEQVVEGRRQKSERV